MSKIASMCSVLLTQARDLVATGRYGEALPLLGEAIDAGPPDVTAGALGTRAAAYRQLALHERALADDESALALPGIQDAVRAGLLVGLVADGVGLGEPPGALLRRMEDARDAVRAVDDDRQRIRLGWVGGEVALVGGRPDEAATLFARARDLAAQRGMRRHEAKSVVFAAAAASALGDPNRAEFLAHEGRELAESCAAVPLQWPAWMILAETAAVRGAGTDAARAWREAGRLLATTLEGLPPEVALRARERPPAVWLLPSGDGA